jgi:hypothetical protein
MIEATGVIGKRHFFWTIAAISGRSPPKHIIQHICLSEVLIQKVAKTCLVIKFNQVKSCYIRPRDNFPQPSLTLDATVPYLAGMNCPWHLTAIL